MAYLRERKERQGPFSMKKEGKVAMLETSLKANILLHSTVMKCIEELAVLNRTGFISSSESWQSGTKPRESKKCFHSLCIGYDFQDIFVLLK
jgi:hypothetical protein